MSDIHITTWDGDADELARAAQLYVQVFAEPPYDEDPDADPTIFEERVRRYAAEKADTRLVLARDGDDVVGLAFGSAISEGDWWRDRIVDLVPHQARERWLRDECFSVAELAIAGAQRRSGAARRLMTGLLTDLPYSTAVLGCYRDATPARRFYAGLGWQEIATDVRIGTSPALCILARDLP